MGAGAMLTAAFLIAVGALTAASSVVFNWASGKSAAWNIGFAVALVLLLATVLIVAITITVARLGY
jgi:hypothetical protein